MITQLRLKELFDYNPETGILTRILSVRGSRNKAGSNTSRGYLSICVDYKQYLIHRLVWLYVYGSFPITQIDHINGNKSDNRLMNLREANNKENSENIKLYSCNKSGYRGVIQDKRTGRWVARVRHFNEDIHVGVFDTAIEASIAVKSKRDELFTHHKTEYSA